MEYTESYSGIRDKSLFDVYETNEQYAHLEGQNGIAIYTLQSLGDGFAIMLLSVSAILVARAAFLGITI